MDRKSPLTPLLATAIAILMVFVLLPPGLLGNSTAVTVNAASPAPGPTPTNDRAAPMATSNSAALSSPAGPSLPQTNERTPDGWNSWKTSRVQDPPSQEGCGVASFGSTTWQPSQCSIAALGPSLPSASGSASSVGNGNDYVASETSANIGSVVGTFPATSGLTSETGGHGIGPFTKANCAGGNLPNCYELQINTNFFWTSTPYTGGGTYEGWEQFLYGNPPGGGSGGVYIEVWLFNYYYVNGDTCPATIPGFGSWFNSSADCTANGIGTAVPNIPATSLGSVTFSAYTNYMGSGKDVAMICISGGSCYSFSMTDTVLELYNHWNQAEYNVFGNEDGSGAYFNAGTSIEVENNLTDGSGNAIPATCLNNGTTGESNNLFLEPCSGKSNGIVFTEASQAFSISVTPSDVTVLRGQTAAYDVTLTLTGGTAAPVGLSVISGLPSGATALLAGGVTPTGYTGLFIFTSLSGSLGDFTFTVQAQFGVVIETASANLHVYDFSVGLSPSDQTVLRGTSTSYAMTLKLLAGSSTVNVPAEVLSVSGLPADATHGFSAPSVVPTLAGSTPSTLTVKTLGPSTGSLGDFAFTVAATDPNPSGGFRSASANLHIFDFTVGLVPLSRTTLRGTSTEYALTLTLVAGSSTVGIPAMGITVSGLPSDATFVLSATSITPTLLGSTPSTLTVTTQGPPTGSLGDFPFTVTATDPNPSGGSRTGSPSLHVFDFTVTLSPSAETLVQGGTVTMTISLGLVSGSTTTGLPNIAMSLTGLPSGVIAVGYPAVMSIGSTLTFTLETSTVASYVSCPQVRNGGGQLLPDANLAHCDLGGYDLHGDQILNANLEGANLQDANLAGADLQGANLASANTAGTDFQGARMPGVDLSSEFPLGIFTLTAIGAVDGGSRMGTTNLTVLGNQLSGDEFLRTYLPYADLTDDVAVGTNFLRANLEGADLLDVDLQSANFQYADLEAADLAGTTLTGIPSQLTNFQGADLEYADLTDAICGSPNNIVANGANTQHLVNVPASCNPPLGHALGVGLTSGSPLSPSGLPAWVDLILGLGGLGAAIGLVAGRRRRRPPQSAARILPPSTWPTNPGDRQTDRRPGHLQARRKTTGTTMSAEDVIRKARAAQAALVARGEYYSARKLAETTEMLAGLAGLPKERSEPDSMYR
jgi:uncharacterized protein YjbI with pentapeptide repeats